ncbi:MAG: RNA polymerase sigma factor [Marinibacterium sp.]|nr:RNA polymerase sigma factor [Marinibacterium sp.]
MDGATRISGAPPDRDGAQAEAALLAAFARGDRGAAVTLTQSIAPRIFAMACRMLGDRSEAEDVTQEALLRLWRIAPDWEPGRAQVSTWVYQVALNLCRDRLRRHGGRALDLDAVPEPPDEAPSALARMAGADRAAALQAALDTLPERQRQAVMLRHLEDLANPEIAQIMEISVEAVESLTARGKRALVAALKGRRADLGFEDDE